MHSFIRRNETLFCEGVSLEKLAKRFGTPLYVYSRATLERHYRVYDEAFSAIPHQLCFSVKANSNIAILRLLANLGAGAAVVSGGEIFRAETAGIPSRCIVYSGVGKKPAEMKQALEAEILMFNLESYDELVQLNDIARLLGRKARVAFKINPGVIVNTHHRGEAGASIVSKFGISHEDAMEAYEVAGRMRNIDVVGIDCHVGSQLTEIEPFAQAVQILRKLVRHIRLAGLNIRCLDLGGGLGVTYDAEAPPSPREYGEMVCEQLRRDDLKLILEPGRNIAGNAGVLIGRVLYTKESGGRHFVIADAGMNDLVRPSLYNSYHEIVPVVDEQRERRVMDVVGPTSEHSDFLARQRELPELNRGEYIAVMSAGAYGFSMASSYNSRRLAAEVLVDGEKAFLIRTRGSLQDLVRDETIPEVLMQ
jgi:diaminopimelate decarboxylase